MKITLYTVEEANRVAQQIRPTLERLVEARREFESMQTRIDALALALSGASPGNPDARAHRQVIERGNHHTSARWRPPLPRAWWPSCERSVRT